MANEQPRMRIAVTGASGLLGGALVPRLRAAGHTVLRLVRTSVNAADEIGWDPATGRIDTRALADVDAVVHLAGENLAAGRWTAARKAAIRASRVDSTALLARTLADLPRPALLACASAAGFYGDGGDALLYEDSPPGHGFLAETCRDWEAAAEPARQAGVRVAHLRLGIVLAGNGGALAQMVPAFRLGLGGRIGSGRQWLPWIALEDAVAAFHAVLHDPQLAGPINVVAPQAVRQAEFARTLAHVLHRPAVLPLPKVGVRVLLGQLGVEALLLGQHVVPRRLQDAGFPYTFPELEGALRAALD